MALELSPRAVWMEERTVPRFESVKDRDTFDELAESDSYNLCR